MAGWDGRVSEPAARVRRRETGPRLAAGSRWRRSAAGRSADAARRFLLLAALLVAGYFAKAPFFYESALVDVVPGWIAVTGGAILAAAGTAAAVSRAVIRTAHGGFVVT